MHDMPEPRSLDHLFAQVSRLHDIRGNHAFADLKLHHGQSPMLHLLIKQDGQTHSELAAARHVSAPTVSKTVQRMESSGLVMRKPDPDDERVSRVYVTDMGREAYRKMTAVMTKLTLDMESALTPAECEDLFRILLKLRDHFMANREQQD